jgi:hypothetical protein
MFASRTPGSTGIIVDVPPMEAAARSKMPSGQLRARAARSAAAQIVTLTQQTLQEGVYGKTEFAGLSGYAGFGIGRDIEPHPDNYYATGPRHHDGS